MIGVGLCSDVEFKLVLLMFISGNVCVRDMRKIDLVYQLLWEG